MSITKEQIGVGFNILKEYTPDKKFPRLYFDSDNQFYYTDIIFDDVKDNDIQKLFNNGWNAIYNFWGFF